MRSSQKYLDIHLAEQNKKHTFALANQQGAIAQLVEQRTENPCVPGSIPGGTTEERKCILLTFINTTPITFNTLSLILSLLKGFICKHLDAT